MGIVELEPFISGRTLVLAEMALVFGVLIWFGRAQIRAVRRPPGEEDRPSALAADARRWREPER